MRIDRKFFTPLGMLIALQILDLIVHAATLQVEPIRITSNLVIVIGALAGVLSIGSKISVVIYLAAAFYLVLNLLFVMQHGAVNPATDALRLPLLAFVAGSLAVAFWLSRRMQ